MIKGKEWSKPEEIEIIRSQGDNKERLIEKLNIRTKRNNYVLLAEFPIYNREDKEEINSIWSLAKKVAYEYLKLTWLQDAMIVTYVDNNEKTGRQESIAVYKKF